MPFMQNPDIQKIWISFFDSKTDNAANLLNSLKKFGFDELDITANDLSKSGRVIQLEVPPFRIDC